MLILDRILAYFLAYFLIKFLLFFVAIFDENCILFLTLFNNKKSPKRIRLRQYIISPHKLIQELWWKDIRQYLAMLNFRGQSLF